ncbi:MAG: Holliday junction resolvase RuvX [Bacteroidota bacterium]
MALDYGSKRTGIAVSDRLKMIASPLDTVKTEQLLSFLSTYLQREEVETIVVGLPVDLMNRETHGTKGALKITKKIKAQFPDIGVVNADERFTSKMAFEGILASGIPKKKRTDKELVDKLSATIILQSYMEQMT